MSIKQFNGNYLPAEDRLFFCFNTLDDSEYRFWLTRRVTQFILAAANHLVAKQLEQTHTPSVARAISDFNQQSIKESTDFSVEYKSATQYPLGENALLVIDIRCSLTKKGNEDFFLLDFVLPDEKNVNLQLSLPILQTLTLLLERLNTQANWGNQINPAPLPEAETIENKKIH
jgi:hypothetical protein